MGLTSMYFAGVMVLLILVATLSVCLINSVAISVTIKNLTSLIRIKTKALQSSANKGAASLKVLAKVRDRILQDVVHISVDIFILYSSLTMQFWGLIGH